MAVVRMGTVEEAALLHRGLQACLQPPGQAEQQGFQLITPAGGNHDLGDALSPYFRQSRLTPSHPAAQACRSLQADMLTMGFQHDIFSIARWQLALQYTHTSGYAHST